MTTVPVIIWLYFNISIILLLLVDAFIFNPKNTEMSLRRALGISVFWVLLALLFNLGIFYYMGHRSGMEFLTAYVVEQSLSVDNLFVFMLIFTHFKVSTEEQKRILMIGIISAQVMRAVFILGGVAILNQFHWMIYIFGGFLVVTGIKLFVKQQEEVRPQENPVVKWIGKKLPIFWVVLIVIEVTDLIFAIDSIPAVLGITKDPFIAYTSNIFAILGLRAMYFALASFMKVFHYLHYGLGVILIFVGLKMLTEHFFHIPSMLALMVIILILFVTVLVSVLCPPRSLQKS